MSEASGHRYILALGSNMRLSGVGGPRAVLRAAIEVLADQELDVLAVSPIIASAPVGPSQRRYANAAILVASHLSPPDMLSLLQAVERDFGRQRRGQRWRARTLDLDIVLWTGGIWVSPDLAIPHPAFRERPFVLIPAAQIAPGWRDPLTGLTLRQLEARAV
ncbi:2-amino-4-hydroxy-6-hydroxymethyldihydropteridine diphosphokinase [Qipengyuania sp. 902]|uniref:2-amino-4-hydroxy-6- hydroxymethyldihydropteridine diphosphokinase n=1 Tax=Qipengyuania sp. 902 TaxID=3417565 RepID=UPI003EBC4980